MAAYLTVCLIVGGNSSLAAATAEKHIAERSAAQPIVDDCDIGILQELQLHIELIENE